MAALLPVYSGPLQGRFRSLGSTGFGADARVIVLHTGKESLIERFVVLMAAIRDELDGARPEASAVATDLVRVMFVRRHLEDQPPLAGLLALLPQRMTAPAVLAMLRDPAR
jgi:AraC family transcriptional regulator, activator of mtrCDE